MGFTLAPWGRVLTPRVFPSSLLPAGLCLQHRGATCKPPSRIPPAASSTPPADDEKVPCIRFLHAGKTLGNLRGSFRPAARQRPLVKYRRISAVCLLVANLQEARIASGRGCPAAQEAESSGGVLLSCQLALDCGLASTRPPDRSLRSYFKLSDGAISALRRPVPQDSLYACIPDAGIRS
ncbi:uncharacterized protein C8Q71DRAFT_233655 [Rhodofomes roseus]|uniref:Uncharacterized protein n=1 Tax=Rhodofomes roseus TaxID=34475 RepID=A0ABQ8KW62_9APHY|nr:uncharacterized protein C8Q71DRAFT_233655 [Rhodofomes roseus]KAH9843061.1 hypothetical protein C8Q71DRAFT_233655 [Rhodofomes roseus]